MENENAVSPKVIACPKCAKTLKVAKSGRYRCPGCQSILIVDTQGNCTLEQAAQSPQVVVEKGNSASVPIPTAPMNYDEFEQQLGLVLEKDGLEAGLVCINNYIAANPNSYMAYLQKSECSKYLGDYQSALGAVDKAVSINPNVPEVYVQRGTLNANAGGDVDQIINDFTKAIELGTTDSSAYTNRGSMYLRTEEYKKAIDDCTKAIEMSSEKEPEALYNRGRAYMLTEKYEKALADFNEFIALETENAEAYLSRGMLNGQLGNTQDAIRDYEKFLQMDPDNENAQDVRDEIEKIKSGGTPTSFDSDEVLKIKKELKVLLILSVIGAVIGALAMGTDRNAGGLTGAFAGMWIGIGFGCGFSVFYDQFGFISFLFKTEGFIKVLSSIKFPVILCFILLFVSLLAGPVGLLVRVLIKKHKITKIQKMDDC